MRYIQPNAKTGRQVFQVKKAGVFALLLAACMLFLPGCQGPLAPQDANTGTLSLTIDGPAGRTIMPPLGTTWSAGSAEFRLDFFAVDRDTDTDEASFSETWDGSGLVENLYPGTWNLVVTAFLQPGLDRGLLAARGSRKNLVIASGPNDATIALYPIAGDDLYGTFSWDIGFPEGLDTVVMEIRTVDGNLLDPPVSIMPANLNARWASYLPLLPTGRYLVVLRMSGDELGSTMISEILHVYSNLASHFHETLTDLHFPRSLLCTLADAWDGTAWVGMNIGYRHFAEILEVAGITGGNFDNIVTQFGIIAGTDFPRTEERLKVLIDAALIGIATGEDFRASPLLSYQGAVRKAIAALPVSPNGSDICMDDGWTNDYRSLTLRVSNEAGDIYYDVLIEFGREIPLLPPLTGIVSITGDTWVGATLTASVIGSNATGPFSFQWVRVIGASETEIVGATGATHNAVTGDLGHGLSVIVSHPDFSGSIRPVVPTAAIRPAPIRPSGANLAAQLAWLRNNARSNGGEYIVEIHSDETIGPDQADAWQGIATLPTGRTNLTITFRGIGTMRTVSLSSNGVLFAVGFGVTLVLDENVTLMGRGPNAIPASVSNNSQLVRVNEGGVLVMNAGSRVTGNTNGVFSGAGGGGVLVNNGGVFILDGGEISGNSATETIAGADWPGHGGGVRVDGGGRFDMRRGTISGNVAGAFGGGVRVSSGGTFRMSGGTIYGNDAASGLRSTSGDGTSASLSNAGTAMAGTFNAAGVFTQVDTLASTNVTIRVVNGIFQVNRDTVGNTIVPGINLVDQLAWLRGFARSNGEYIVEIRANETIGSDQLWVIGGDERDATLPTGRTNLTITLRGIGAMRTVSLSNNGILFGVVSGVTLVLDGNVTLMGRGPNAVPATASNNSQLVRVNEGGVLIMNTGSRVTGNTNGVFSGAGGGGVLVNNGGVFILDGGEISGNSATETIAGADWPGHGGGVRVDGGGRFDMRRGTISGNVAGAFGGGVRVSAGGTFRMSGGTIHGNAGTTASWLRNTSGDGTSAALSNGGTALSGTFDYADRFIQVGTLATTNSTITR